MSFAPVLANHDFRRLWLVGTLSSMGRWLDTLAFAIVAYQQSGSPFIVAMLSMLRMLPMGLCGPLLATFADRVQRRTVFLAAIGLNLAMATGLMLLSASGRLAIWHLAVAAFVNGMSWTAENTVRRVNLGELVGSEALPRATSLDAASANAARMLGPTAGGLFLATVGITGAFGLGMALYVVSLLAMLGYRYQHRLGGGVTQSTFSRLIEGFSLARRSPKLVGTLVITVIFNLWGWPVTAMVPVLAQGQLGLGPEATGLLVSLDGLGALLAAVLVGWLVTTRWHGAVYAVSVGSYGVLSVGLALSHHVLPAGLAILLSGAASAGFGIMQTTLTYLAAPPDLRGRAFGVLALCIGLAPLGFVHLGLLADATSSATATMVVGAEGVVALALTWRWWRAVLVG